MTGWHSTRASLGDRRWMTVAIAVLLIILSAYAVFVVLLGLVSGGHHAWVFWPTIALFILVAIWAARCAGRLLRRIMCKR